MCFFIIELLRLRLYSEMLLNMTQTSRAAALAAMTEEYRAKFMKSMMEITMENGLATFKCPRCGWCQADEDKQEEDTEAKIGRDDAQPALVIGSRQGLTTIVSVPQCTSTGCVTQCCCIVPAHYHVRTMYHVRLYSVDQSQEPVAHP